MVTRAEFRRRGRSWLALAVLLAGVGGLVLVTATAGWRTASAFPRYLGRYGFDSFMYGTRPLDSLASLPEVRSVVALTRPPANGAVGIVVGVPVGSRPGGRSDGRSPPTWA